MKPASRKLKHGEKTRSSSSHSDRSKKSSMVCDETSTYHAKQATENNVDSGSYLVPNTLYLGDCREKMVHLRNESVALSFWSPPYFVGKEYEKGVSFDDWRSLLREVIHLHYAKLIPGGFMVVNIANILCFQDPSMPRIQAPNIRLHRSPITKEHVLAAKSRFPQYSRYELAEYLGCSEQTVDRRLNGNNIRGGKYGAQTRVKLVGGMIDEFSRECGLYLYDHRIWAKDPTWANSQWHSSSYRSVSEFEDLYIFWKPGETEVDRQRLKASEWSEWGSRAIWQIRSVQKNDDHPAKFPKVLAKQVIRLFSAKGSLVLDPFVGSGTTCVAAIETGRQYIGIEKDRSYFRLAERQVDEAEGLLIKSDC
jgi:DNA modification methylase